MSIFNYESAIAQVRREREAEQRIRQDELSDALDAAAALRELEAENDERGATITKAAVQVTELRARVAELEAELDRLRSDLAASFAAGLKIEQRARECEAERDRLREALDTAARRFEILAMQGVMGTEVVSTEVGGKEARAALEGK